jgi:hypothetical protein
VLEGLGRCSYLVRLDNYERLSASRIGRDPEPCAEHVWVFLLMAYMISRRASPWNDHSPHALIWPQAYEEPCDLMIISSEPGFVLLIPRF